MTPYWKGVFPAVTTQFREDSSLDLPATERHLGALLESGVTGFVMLGSLGEYNGLDREEKRELVRLAVSVSAGRVPVLGSTAEWNAPQAIAWIRELESLGANGAMVLPPMAFRPDREETLAHYEACARATTLPLMVYNNPISYHADVLPEMFAELARHETIVAIKESSGDVRRVTDIRNEVGDRYAIFCGVDDLALEATFLGAVGWVAGVGLAFPAENQRLWELATSERWNEARDLYRWYTPLLHLDVGTKFVQNIKLAIQEVGLGSEFVRSPRLPLAGQERARVLAVIRRALETRPSAN